ncbi:MAG: DUF2125 domain-containing protein [Alphaproteobacteria bacterium]|nr:DUF2125 domain-containing protein [Alphaproteobacteria bacterium]
MSIKSKSAVVAAILVPVLVLLALFWSVFWWIAAREIRDQAESLRASVASDGYDVYGAPVSVGGFPGPHEVRFSGGLRGFGLNVEVPLLVAEGFFMPGQEVFVTLPGGARLLEPSDPHGLWRLKSAVVSFIIPEHIPAELTAPHMKAWQEAGGTLDITGFDIKREDLAVTGKGVVRLDPDLQPEGRIALEMTGHLKFLETLKNAGLINPNQVMLVGALLAAASKPAPETGELMLSADLIVQDRTLTIGPARVGSLPAIEWPRPSTDRRNPPAPPQ